MIRTVTELGPVDRFFLEQSLEMGNEPVERHVQKIWIDEEEGRMVGAATLGLREGHYVVDGIALLPDFRRQGRGRALLECVVQEARDRGAHVIWLVAKAPDFFAREGFSFVEASVAPRVFGCEDCSIRGIDCHPRWMLRELR